MSIFTRIAATALTGFAALGFASASFAHHLEQQPYVEFESALVLRALQETGHRIYADDPICDEKKGLMGVANSRKGLLICVDNHRGNDDEMADTLRHEAIHLVQYCNARNNGATHSVLFPSETDAWITYAQEHLHWNIKEYDEGAWGPEAEARVLARHLDEHHVAQLLVKHCEVGR